jgi:hypothetical protein
MTEYGSRPRKLGESTIETGVPVLGAGEPLPTVEAQRAEEVARREELNARLAGGVLGMESSYGALDDEIKIHPAGTFEVDLKPGDIGYNGAIDADPSESYHIPGSDGPGSAGSR